MSEEKIKKVGFFGKFLMAMGAIFLALIIFVVILVILFKTDVISFNGGGDVLNSETTSEGDYNHPLLSDSQEKTLKSLGVKVEEIPTEISKSQEECAVLILGEERVNEISKGSSPSVIEIVKLKSCLDK